MLLRIGLVMTMVLGTSFAHAQDSEENGAAPAAQHDDFNSDVDKAAATPTDKPHHAATPDAAPKASHPVAGASGKKSKKAKAASKKKRQPSSIAKKKSKKHGSKKKKKHS